MVEFLEDWVARLGKPGTGATEQNVCAGLLLTWPHRPMDEAVSSHLLAHRRIGGGVSGRRRTGEELGLGQLLERPQRNFLTAGALSYLIRS